MAFFEFKNIRVAGVACAVPKNVVRTDSFKPLFGDEEVEKFMAMTGVRESRRTLEHQTACDLCFRAAEELLQAKRIDRLSNLYYLKISHNRKCLLITSLLQS